MPLSLRISGAWLVTGLDRPCGKKSIVSQNSRKDARVRPYHEMALPFFSNDWIGGS